MARIGFWGGVGIIGSTKVLIEQDGWRVLLDFGLDYLPGQGLYRSGVTPRGDVRHYLRDRLRVDGAPWLPNIYRADALGDLPLASGGDGRTAVFITHGHLDHMGLIGMLDPTVPVHASPGTVRLLTTLRAHGDDVAGGLPPLVPMEDGASLTWGPFTVTRYPVDHDVVGSSGYRVDTEDGVVAYTGDIRLHGRRSEESLRFADAVHGARALVIEGTTLSQGFRVGVRTEKQVDESFRKVLRDTPGLALATMYPRNVERIAAFLDGAAAMGRRMAFTPAVAAFLSDFLGREVPAWGEEGTAVSIDAVRDAPDRYVLVLGAADWPTMLDLPMGPGSVFIHANGEPLGPFDPTWDLLQEWLAHLHTPFWAIGTGGHATPDDLNRLVERVAPEVLFPVHSLEPDRLVAPPGTMRWLPQRGRVFELSGRRTQL